MFLSFVFRVRFTASVTQLFSYIVFVLLSPVPPDILIQHTKLRERLMEPTVMTKGNNLQFRRNVLQGASDLRDYLLIYLHIRMDAVDFLDNSSFFRVNNL